jgi:hypothetical protein
MFRSIVSEELCCLGCQQVAIFEAKNGKKYCSNHSNKCPEKRRRFSEEVNHKEYSAKSLQTRIQSGITKTSQVKGGKTRVKNGHYLRLSETMKRHWINTPWNVKRSRWSKYKTTDILIQSQNEYDFMQELENEHGINWVRENVQRGHFVWYVDPETNQRRIYFPDFQIGNLVYEVKSRWTWDKKGSDNSLRMINEAKLDEVCRSGKEVILIIDGEVIEWTPEKQSLRGSSDIVPM